MDESPSSPAPRGAADLQLDADIGAVLRDRLPAVAAQTVAAVTEEVPSYAGAFSGTMGDNIEAAVQMALAGFLKLASGSRDSDPSTPHGPTLEGAYALGRGEARSGRSMDALLAAYRVGARVAWREMADAATKAGVAASTMARFAELVFAYIDELSAASAERADWPEPRTLTAVLLPAAQVRGVLSLLASGTLRVGDELPGLEDSEELSLLLVPDMEGRDRRRLLRVLAGKHAVVGPPRPWLAARASYLRAARVVDLVPAPDPPAPLDTEDHLVDVVLGADPDALADLRTRVLEPLSELRPATAQRLGETLRSWLLHQGRRDDVAADLHVHAQTVRYRMGQLRDLYGDRLDDPQVVLELLLALHPRAGEDVVLPDDED